MEKTCLTKQELSVNGRTQKTGLEWERQSSTDKANLFSSVRIPNLMPISKRPNFNNPNNQLNETFLNEGIQMTLR